MSQQTDPPASQVTLGWVQGAWKARHCGRAMQGPGHAPVAALGEQAGHRGGRLWLGRLAGGLVIWGVKMRSREVQGWGVEGPVAHGQVEEGLTVWGKSVLGPGPRGKRAP